MSSLKEIQQQMLDDLVARKSEVDYLNNPQRLDVYGKGYFVRIKLSLADDYSYTGSLMESSLFEEMILKYIRTHPSKNYNLNHFGLQFPQFIAQELPNMPWLADMARYEYNKIQSYHCEHLPPVDMEKFKTTPMEQWEDAKFIFQPHLTLMKTNWPILELFKYSETKTKFSPSDIQPLNSHYMLYQFEDASYVKSVDEAEFKILELLQRGQTLGDVCRSFDDESIMQSIFTWFQSWHSLELITNIEFESHESN